jgi:hypothetical protein
VALIAPPAGPRSGARRPRWWIPALLFIPLLWFLGNLIYWEHEAHRQLEPPPNVTSLREFVAWKGPAATYWIIHDRGLVIARVQFHESDRLASGPAAYVFDSTGKLVDWTEDDGEGFYQHWPFPTAQDAAPAADAVEFVAERAKARK